MIKKLFTKYFLEVIPSIVATVVGAYIVTHYINAKSEADKPKAAISAPAVMSKDAGKDANRESAKKPVKADETAQTERAAKAEAARKAAEMKAAADKVAADKASAEKAAAEKLAGDKAAAEKRERATAKAAPVVPPSSEANATPEDRRDANDLARAAIERLRNAGPRASEPRSSETPRTPEAARVEEPSKPQERAHERARVNSVVYAPAASPQPAIQSLPPAVTVAPPPSEAAITAPPAPFPVPTDEVRNEDSPRPMPPGEIPPRDIRAHERDRSVAEGVVSAAKSVFQAVLPERN